MARFAHKSIGCVLHGVILLLLFQLASAQDAPFKPRWDGVQRAKHAKKSVATPNSSSENENAPVYSFDRYASKLREVCNLMELDGRRERLGKAAFDDIRDGSPCRSCRAFLKEVVEQCQYRKRVALRPTPAPRPRASSELDPSSEPGALTGDGQSTPLPTQLTPLPTFTTAPIHQEPSAARYPRTDLLDRMSALSNEFYERDSGDGSTFESVKYLADLIMNQKDLSPAERDYFGIFTTYLLSSWSGREDSPLDSPAPSREEVRSLFAAE